MDTREDALWHIIESAEAALDLYEQAEDSDGSVIALQRAKDQRYHAQSNINWARELSGRVKR